MASSEIELCLTKIADFLYVTRRDLTFLAILFDCSSEREWLIVNVDELSRGAMWLTPRRNILRRLILEKLEISEKVFQRDALSPEEVHEIISNAFLRAA